MSTWAAVPHHSPHSWSCLSGMGFLTAERKTVKNKQGILDSLVALWLLTKLTIIHCLGHQKANTPMARGNQRADKTAKAVVEQATEVLALTLPDPGPPDLPEPPAYSSEDLCMIPRLSIAQEPKKWWVTDSGRPIS